MSDMSGTLPAAPSRHYFLTYFGTFLVGTDRDDWIAHAPLSADAMERLIFVETRPADRPDSTLRKSREAPRRLPDFHMEPNGSDRHALRCAAIRPNEGVMNHFMAAMPDGRVEINRGEASYWEEYCLLSDQELDWLVVLMTRAQPFAEDAARFEWRFIDDFRISDGQHTYDVRRMVRAGILADLKPGTRLSLLDDVQAPVDIVVQGHPAG